MVSFVTNHWEVISFVALVLINVMNAATKHWSTHTGLVKWLLFISEILSFFKSGSLKFPFSSAKSIIVLGVVLSLGGCASFPKRMAQIHEGAKGVSAIAEPAFHARCLALAEQCKKEQDTTCKPWIECDSQRSAVNRVIKAIHVAVATGLGMDAIGQAKRAEVMLAEAFALMSRLMELTTKYGILGEQR